MSKIVSLIASALVFAGLTFVGPSEAKGRRHQHVTRIAVTDWRFGPQMPCAPEIYPYAPSACLRGGFIAFDDKAYFAPRYGYRAHRYYDGW